MLKTNELIIQWSVYIISKFKLLKVCKSVALQVENLQHTASSVSLYGFLPFYTSLHVMYTTRVNVINIVNYKYQIIETVFDYDNKKAE